MKNLLILLLIIPNLSFPQAKADDEVFKRVLEYEFQDGSFYIECRKAKTYFDSEEFKTENGLEVPDTILSELKNESSKSSDSNWEKELFDSKLVKSFLRSDQCLTKVDCENLFETTGRRQRIISVSDPIFDSGQENCVVSVTFWSFKGSAAGRSYFLTKVYGRWTIIFTYAHWIT